MNEGCDDDDAYQLQAVLSSDDRQRCDVGRRGSHAVGCLLCRYDPEERLQSRELFARRTRTDSGFKHCPTIATFPQNAQRSRRMHTPRWSAWTSTARRPQCLES
jgi:hypothetical protein